MDRETAREYIKQNISCTDYLLKAPNYSQHNETGYCCPLCGSGTHRGNKSDGAVQFYRDTNTWHCHICKKGGDVIDLYMNKTGADYNTALTELAARAGVTIDKNAERPQSDYKRADDRQPQKYEKDAHRGEQGPAADYTAYYQACRAMLHDPAAVTYLQARGISTETAERCGIGFDPAADPAAAPGATTDAGKQHPTPRIIAPCTKDFYIARATDPHTAGRFKAINPKGSSAQLFNAAAIYNNDVVFITEGLFDALSFIEAGAAAIALNSKGNGKLLLKLLQERPAHTSFIICPDNDDDTTTAADTMRQANELNDALQAMDVKSIVYNVAGIYHDANDALQNDRPNFERALQAAVEELRRDDLTDFLEKIQTEAYKPYKTGLQFFDDLLGGGIIQQSLLLLLAAPGTGKTTLVQQIAETMAKARKPFLYLNFEMSKEQMIAKAISAELKRHGKNMSATDVLQGYSWTEQENKAITKAIQEYRAESYPYIKYKSVADVGSDIDGLLAYLMAVGEKAKASGQPAPAVAVDYLHLITGSGKQDAQELIKQTVTGLKEYAVQYDTFVIGIVAINRSSMKGGKVTPHSGRDSSNIEYTADYQVSLNYTAIDIGVAAGGVDPEDVQAVADLQALKRRPMILRVLKNRFGQPGKYAHVLFDAEHNLFEQDDANHGEPKDERETNIVMTI